MEEWDKKYEPITDTKNFFIEIYPFLDRFQLRVIVARKPHLCRDGEHYRVQQNLGIEYLNKNGVVSDGLYIGCIQVMVASTTLEELESIPKNISKEEYFLGGVSIEKLHEIELDPGEHFFALKSWVQGIAEAGMDLFTDFDTYLEYPAYFRMIYPLFGMVVRHDPSMMPHYLTMLERKCKFEGKWHIPSLFSLLDPILRFLYPSDYFRNDEGLGITNYDVFKDRYNWLYFGDSPEAMKALWSASFKALINMDFPLDVYCKILPYNVFKEHFCNEPGYEETLLNSDFARKFLTDPSTDSAKYIVPASLRSNNPELVEFVLKRLPKPYELPEYRELFHTKSSRIEYLLAEEPEAAKFSEYRDLFRKALTSWEHDREGILYAIVRNENAMDLPEYQEMVNEMKQNPDSIYFHFFNDRFAYNPRSHFSDLSDEARRKKLPLKFRRVLEDLLPYWEQSER